MRESARRAAALLALALCAALPCSRAQTAQQMSLFAAMYNQDIIINADLFASYPQMMSGGLGFTSIIGVDNTNETAVRSAGGAWNTGLTCSNGATPPQRVITSANAPNVWTGGFNCTANLYGGLPVCFSWPVLPSSITKESFLIHLTDGTKVVPPCIGLSPNFEFNERHCVVLFGNFGNRLPSKQGGIYPRRVEVVKGARLKLVGPRGPVRAAGLYFKNKQSPYDGPTTGPVFMAAKLSVLTDLGEGITVPNFASQVAFPNGGVALYGKYDGGLGLWGQRYRLRLFYSGGMTPDGVRAMRPDFFSRFFYLVAEGKDDTTYLRHHRTRMIKITQPGQIYRLGKGIGAVKVLGLADTGRKADAASGVIYDNCYQEDYDNYIDIIVDASSAKAARALKVVRAYYTSEGYSSVYNPGGPGMAPTPGVRYSTPAPPQAVWISHALDNPKTVTWCRYNGTVTVDPIVCSKAVAETLPPAILEKIKPEPRADYPVIRPEELPDFDGLIFGIPTRFGMMPQQARHCWAALKAHCLLRACGTNMQAHLLRRTARSYRLQVKALWDATGGLWASGALVGKPAAAFCSVATQGGGMETTIMTALTQFTHHGMIFVPPGYSFGNEMFNTDHVKAGSPWGAGTFAGGDGSRRPTDVELAYAKHQASFFQLGQYFAKVVKKLAAKGAAAAALVGTPLDVRRAQLLQVAETLPSPILEKIKPEPRRGYPDIRPEQLAEFDGGALVGKPAAAFCSVSTQGGGIETTIMTAVTQFAHHGMIFVPPGYSYGQNM
ncbi:phospholipase carboxylesterase [Chlorella sorokiniana]|uniref:Phospholipase carboxylesterase n=1 Tax=Chlorella sorokiniana TaxID=3076 RepID=A0A2P6TP24_CHLSO|nr:phospholipase carboxylesterase [Chlorella sorokiniana]|eukprot:PRW51084.1 phospholipase carboxylesterase [Chlorella sorokiniana]